MTIPSFFGFQNGSNNHKVKSSYLYCTTPRTNTIKKVSLSDFSTINSINVVTTGNNLQCTDGFYLYLCNDSSNSIMRISLVDYSITTLNIGQYSSAMCIQDDYLYCGGSGSNNVLKISLSGFNIVSTVSINQGTTALCSDGVYIYSGGNSTTLKRVLLSDFTTVNSLVLGGYDYPTNNLCCENGSLYLLSGGDIKLARISTSSFTVTSSIQWISGIHMDYPHGLISDGTYLYLGFTSGSSSFSGFAKITLDFSSTLLLSLSPYSTYYMAGSLSVQDGFIYLGDPTSLFIEKVNLSNFSSVVSAIPVGQETLGMLSV